MMYGVTAVITLHLSENRAIVAESPPGGNYRDDHNHPSTMLGAPGPDGAGRLRGRNAGTGGLAEPVRADLLPQAPRGLLLPAAGRRAVRRPRRGELRPEPVRLPAVRRQDLLPAG